MLLVAVYLLAEVPEVPVEAEVVFQLVEAEEVLVHRRLLEEANERLVQILAKANPNDVWCLITGVLNLLPNSLWTSPAMVVVVVVTQAMMPSGIRIHMVETGRCFVIWKISFF